MDMTVIAAKHAPRMQQMHLPMATQNKVMYAIKKYFIVIGMTPLLLADYVIPPHHPPPRMDIHYQMINIYVISVYLIA